MAVASSGLTGATTATRYVGGTTAGAPASGTFAVGDFIVDQTATIWVCIAAGTPGTWSPTIQSSLVVRSATATAGAGELTIFGAAGASGQTITLPASPQNGSLYQIKNLSAYTVNILGGTQSISVSGTVYSASTPYTVPINTAYTFAYTGGIWYCMVTTDMSKVGGTLPIANGGTGATSAAAALTSLNALSNDTFLGFNQQSSSVIDVFGRNLINQSTGPGTGAIWLTYFTPAATATISQITMASGITASSGLTLARMGLYTVDGSGNLTLVARTASDTTLFNTNQTIYVRNLNTTGGYPATYQLIAGTRYALAIIMTGTTMPSLACLGYSQTVGAAITALSPRTNGTYTGQTDLTTTISVGSIGSNQYCTWGRFS